MCDERRRRGSGRRRRRRFRPPLTSARWPRPVHCRLDAHRSGNGPRLGSSAHLCRRREGEGVAHSRPPPPHRRRTRRQDRDRGERARPYSRRSTPRPARKRSSTRGGPIARSPLSIAVVPFAPCASRAHVGSFDPFGYRDGGFTPIPRDGEVPSLPAVVRSNPQHARPQQWVCVRGDDVERVLDESGEIDAQSMIGVMCQHDRESQHFLPRFGGHQMGVSLPQLGEMGVQATSSRGLIRRALADHRLLGELKDPGRVAAPQIGLELARLLPTCERAAGSAAFRRSSGRRLAP